MDRKFVVIAGLLALGGLSCRRLVESLYPGRLTVHHLVYYPSLGEVEAKISVDGEAELTQMALVFPSDTLVFDTSLALTPEGSPYRIAFPSSAPPDTTVEAVFTYVSAGETSTQTWDGVLAWVNARAAVIGRMVLPESTYVYVIWPRAFPSGRLAGDVRLARGSGIRVLWTDIQGLSEYRNGQSLSRVFLDTTVTFLLDLDRALPAGADTFVTLFEFTAPDTAYVDARLLQFPQ